MNTWMKSLMTWISPVYFLVKIHLAVAVCQFVQMVGTVSLLAFVVWYLYNNLGVVCCIISKRRKLLSHSTIFIFNVSILKVFF